MAEVKIMVGGRQYAVHCRDGEEARLHQLAGMMSDRVNQVKTGSPGLTEVRQLLFAGLLLADTLSDKALEAPAPAAPAEPAAPPPPVDDPDTLAALAKLAERIEALGDSLAAQLSNA
ncbi:MULTISPECIES: cell division protein ZapA [Sphingobium]|uniref:Cell division protein ZapA n=1 Tax=Sphingobium lignivorans TaxID=2735886 RepID=A0ABR6NG37_9SPHN|nr:MULTISPECIES: cell division protein ZapA [Sphingobium]MBB5986250.1 cell division protein ZapA [Sphingobium lignivorans]BAK67013.1 hypothetical protein SLG_23380 [Sphingobium sp. SYK-6]